MNVTRSESATGKSLLLWGAKSFGYEHAAQIPDATDMNRVASEQWTHPVSKALKAEMLRSAKSAWAQRQRERQVNSNPGRRSQRFDRCVESVSRSRGVRSPEAVCAATLRRAGCLKNPPRTYLQTCGRGMVQEWYETGSDDVRERAKELRKLGYKVASGSSYQVTPVGRAKMTLLSIFAGTSGDGDLDNLPAVNEIGFNPGTAEEMSEEFHGRPARSATEVDEVLERETELADLGGMEEVKLLDPDGKHLWTVRMGHDVRLASNAAGSQLYFVGGDQGLNLAAFPWLKKEDDKSKVAVANLYSVVYASDKHHLRGSRGKVQPYEHVFGEEGGELPVLIYDAQNELMELAGGSYKVTDVGIRD
jgi:hypothetical protein